jgi:capsular exopolysaccharide synthesis family protein
MPKPKHRSRRRQQKLQLIGEDGKHSMASEAYRTLRTNISLSQVDRPVRTLLVTSCIPREGKSTTVANLGVTFAMAEKKVLIIDADLRRPILHRLFGIPNNQGLTHTLSDAVEWDQVFSPTKVSNLWVVTCGIIPPNPSELLGSQKMKNFLQRTTERFDIVLLDSPPISSLADASILGAIVDGVLFIVKVNMANRDLIIKAKDQLETVGANIIGVALNDVDIKRDGYYRYYYYYNYEYYGQKG